MAQLDPMQAALLRAEIQDALYRHASVLDQRRYYEWVDLFTADGSYSVITYGNLNHQGLFLLKDDGKEAIKERVAYLMGYWQMERGKTLHVVSNIQLTDLKANEARCRSSFVVYRTGEDGVPKLYSCGEYLDVLVKREERWLFRERKVVIDNETLPPNFTEPP
jgi:3-phenylpropionate/cinnamic acid dioxygenase small subunit